ncbi:Transferase of alkyl or aryl groups [Sarracenia purpurea var. burkii]
MATALSLFNGKPGFPSLFKSNLRRPPPPPSCRPTVFATAHNSHFYLTSIEAEIEVHLKKVVSVRPPITVFEPMHNLVFAAPRTKASALCVAACELVGGHRDQAMVAASALHLMHSAAYTHQQLLSSTTTDQTMIHHAPPYKPNIKLLTGDGIVPFGFELLARSLDPTDQNHCDRVLRVIIELSRAIGSQGFVGGQYKQTESTQSDNEELGHDEGWIEHVCKKKEGEIHACGAACGAILGGGSEEEVEKLRKFGVYVGMMEGIGRNYGKGLMKMVERLRVLALEELESFYIDGGGKIEPIYSLVQPNFFSG